jgi:hypothetical protein
LHTEDAVADNQEPSVDHDFVPSEEANGDERYSPGG